jgi:hypothetical protein
MTTHAAETHIYDGEGDRLMDGEDVSDRIILLPDAADLQHPDDARRLRIMWGQCLLEDLLAGRYRSLVCAVNARDNSHGIINELAQYLPTSQWDNRSITHRAQQFSHEESKSLKVIKYDMDLIEVLALLRPSNHEVMHVDDLATGFKIVAEMIQSRTHRLPSASVSFLGARSNALRDENGREPSFETVLRIIHESGYSGDVYPAPGMWSLAPTAVYARYPFPPSVDAMRHGGS